MISLNRFFENIFYPLESSEISFLDGVDSHIVKMETVNPVGLSANITATITLRDAARAAVSSRGTESGQQQGSTSITYSAKDEFIRFMSVREGLIRSVFEGTSGPYQEFLPAGLTELYTASIGQMQHIMDRIVDAATTYQAQVGAQFLTDVTSKRQAFLDARGAQVVNKEEHTNWQLQVQEAIRLLAVQLSINLHTIAAENVGNLIAADQYFEEHYFQRPEQSGLYTGINAADQTKTVRSQGWSDGKQVRATNKGTSAFKIAFANAEGVPVGTEPAGQHLVPPGETRQYTALELGYAPGNAHLNITADAAGADWEVLVTD